MKPNSLRGAVNPLRILYCEHSKRSGTEGTEGNEKRGAVCAPLGGITSRAVLGKLRNDQESRRERRDHSFREPFGRNPPKRVRLIGEHRIQIVLTDNSFTVARLNRGSADALKFGDMRAYKRVPQHVGF